MTTLYLANCSRQAHEFLYRVPAEDASVSRQVKVVRIEPGSQQRIHGEAPMPVLEAIINQHRAYGILPVDEITKTKAFVGLCFSFDKPVDIDRLRYAVDHNQGVLFDRGEQQRKEAALAVDEALEHHAHAEDLPGIRSVEVEVIEDSDKPTVAMGMDIDRPGRAPSRETLGRRSGRYRPNA